MVQEGSRGRGADRKGGKETKTERRAEGEREGGERSHKQEEEDGQI